MNRKKIFRWIKVIIVAYCIIGISLYYLQDRLMLHPKALPPTYNYNFSIPYKEVNIPFNASSNINIIQFLTDSTARGVVLYFHGNRENISHYEKYAPAFTKKGYEVWMIDYPGFGKSTGEFREQALYDWSLLLYKLSRKRFAPDSIIIYGKSLGTGIATQLASIRDTKHLILESPYFSFPSVIGQYAPVFPLQQMIHYKIPTYRFLQKVDAPVTIFHGKHDGVIRYSNARKLQPYLKTEDEFVTIENGRHNDLPEFPAFQQKLDSILTH